MRRYMYTPPPRGATTDQLADYLNRQLRAIADALNQTLEWDKEHTEPQHLFDGIVRYADGSDWNPDGVHGEGPYQYWDGEWHYLACCDEGGGGGGGGCCWTMSNQTQDVTLALGRETSTNLFYPGDAEVYAPMPDEDNACSALVVGSVTVQLWPTERAGGCPPTRVYVRLWVRDPTGLEQSIGLEHMLVGPTYTVEQCTYAYPITANVALNWTLNLDNYADPDYDNYYFYVKIVYDSSLTDIEPLASAALSVAMLPCSGYVEP